jgi:outer membrane protein assembly factor BamB
MSGRSNLGRVVPVLRRDPTAINGIAYRGSVRRVDPATGDFLWQTGLPNSVLGAPSMNGGGVIAVGTYDFTATPNAVYLLDATTGHIVRTLNTGGKTFAQTVSPMDTFSPRTPAGCCGPTTFRGRGSWVQPARRPRPTRPVDASSPEDDVRTDHWPDDG